MGTPVEEPVGNETPVESGVNPAWNDVLSILPEQFHEAVTGHFKQWDEAANSRIESVNTQLKDYEAYKALVDHSISMDEINQGLMTWHEINTNPENVYNALREAYKFGEPQQPQPQVQPNGNESEDDPFATFDITQHPEYQKLQQNLQTVTQVVYNDVKAKQDAQEDLALETELKGLEAKYAESNLPVPLNMEFVLSKMMNGASGEQAVEDFTAMVRAMQPAPFAPSVLSGNSGSGSGLPSNAIDVTKLSGKETRNLVANFIKNQTQNRG